MHCIQVATTVLTADAIHW